jgi:hypothetical protein
MYYVRFAVRLIVVIAVAGAAILYGFLIYNGDIPAPDLRGLIETISPKLAVGTSQALFLVIAISFLLAAISPFVYAARSGDPFTILVSIVALVAVVALLVGSRTVIDMILAAIVYFTSAFISVIVYATNRITDEIRKQNEDETFDARRGITRPLSV